MAAGTEKKKKKKKKKKEKKKLRPKSNLEGFVWSHQSINGLISQRQFAPKC